MNADNYQQRLTLKTWGASHHKRLNKDEQLKEKRSSFRRTPIAVNLRQMFLSGLGFRGLPHCITGGVSRMNAAPLF